MAKEKKPTEKELIKELEAYKKAKAENDERFIRERDDARAKAEEFRIEMDKQTELKKQERQAKFDALQDAARYKADYEIACQIVASMHAAAVGEIRGPSVGPVEDVAAIRQQLLDSQKMLLQAKPEGVLGDIQAERIRQDAKWGEQNHPDGTCDGPNGPTIARQHADAARSICDHFDKIGKLTWAHIFTEEWLEAYAETDPTKLETELIQVAAVAAAWVECIRRRQGGRAPGK
jgi:hypothetical protein